MYVRIHAYMLAYMHICKCASIYGYMLAYMHVCKHICAYMLACGTCPAGGALPGKQAVPADRRPPSGGGWEIRNGGVARVPRGLHMPEQSGDVVDVPACMGSVGLLGSMPS